MPEPARRLTVFVSSTSEDLRDYRAVARSVILDMQWYPEMMEHFGAVPDVTVDACRAKVASCDLVLLIVAHRRGWVPTVEQGGTGKDSITALELQHARSCPRPIPVLAMMADDNWPGGLWEGEQAARDWIEAFRANLNLPAAFFKYEEPVVDEARRLPVFRAAVRNVLMDHRDRLAARARPAAGALDFFESALNGFADGAVIPFLGHGMYKDGPLGLRSLIAAFGEPAVDQACLATAAEYRERFRRDRRTFLREFRRSLEDQVRASRPAPVHDLLVGLATSDRLPLIVSTTYDQVLEGRLTAAGKPPVVVTHVLRSTSAEHDGKILVLRPGRPPEICLSDQVELGKGELVVYKPLGSPFLNFTLEPETDIDTVVVTESDHLAFLTRLDNQGTGIPTALVRSYFRKFRLLFLGYTLDVWQYRLVMQVFELLKARAGDRGGPDLAPLSVRCPASQMEELLWQRLNADLVPQDPDEFAQRVIAALP